MWKRQNEDNLRSTTVKYNQSQNYFSIEFFQTLEWLNWFIKYPKFIFLTEIKSYKESPRCKKKTKTKNKREKKVALRDGEISIIAHLNSLWRLSDTSFECLLFGLSLKISNLFEDFRSDSLTILPPKHRNYIQITRAIVLCALVDYLMCN